MGRERRGEAPSNVLCQFSESIRRNTDIRPTLAWGEQKGTRPGMGLVVKGEFCPLKLRIPRIKALDIQPRRLTLGLLIPAKP